MKDGVMLLLLKHQLSYHQQGRTQRERATACLPETSVLIDLCRKHYALVAKIGEKTFRTRPKFEI